MEENIMLIVSDETYDRTATESVRPSSENRQTTARSGEKVESVIGWVWVKVLDIGTSMDGAATIASVGPRGPRGPSARDASCSRGGDHYAILLFLS